MADGNYNKNILPYNNYQSGVRAGRAMERTRAMEIFARIIDEEKLCGDSAEADELKRKFHELLVAK